MQNEKIAIAREEILSCLATHRCLRFLSKASPDTRRFRADEMVRPKDGINPGHEISRSQENTSASRHEARLRNLNSLISIFSSYYPPFKGEPRITDSEVIGLRERHRDNAVVSIVYFLFFPTFAFLSLSLHSFSFSLSLSHFLSTFLSLSHTKFCF